MGSVNARGRAGESNEVGDESSSAGAVEVGMIGLPIGCGLGLL